MQSIDFTQYIDFIQSINFIQYIDFIQSIDSNDLHTNHSLLESA